MSKPSGCIKNITPSVPLTNSRGENSITNPYDIVNILTNYFSYVADTAKETLSISIETFQSTLIISAKILYSFSLLTVRK